MRAHSTFLICLVFLLSLAGTARAGSATAAVRSANQTVSRLLKKKAPPGSEAERRQAARVTRELRSFLDVDELGQRAMVDHWSQLSAEQQKEFLTLLRTLIEKNYVKGLRANLKYKVRYTGEKAQGDQTLVTTEIDTKRHGRPFTIGIDYLVRNEKGTWRTVDVITDGVGLIENYRSQFNSIIGKHGVEGLLERMRKKSAEE